MSYLEKIASLIEGANEYAISKEAGGVANALEWVGPKVRAIGNFLESAAKAKEFREAVGDIGELKGSTFLFHYLDDAKKARLIKKNKGLIDYIKKNGRLTSRLASLGKIRKESLIKENEKILDSLKGNGEINNPLIHLMNQIKKARLIKENDRLANSIKVSDRLIAKKRAAIDGAIMNIQYIHNFPEGEEGRAVVKANRKYLRSLLWKGTKGAAKTGLVYGAPAAAGYGGYRYIENRRDR